MHVLYDYAAAYHIPVNERKYADILNILQPHQQWRLS